MIQDQYVIKKNLYLTHFCKLSMKNAKKRGRKQHVNATCQNDFDLGYFSCFSPWWTMQNIEYPCVWLLGGSVQKTLYNKIMHQPRMAIN